MQLDKMSSCHVCSIFLQNGLSYCCLCYSREGMQRQTEQATQVPSHIVAGTVMLHVCMPPNHSGTNTSHICVVIQMLSRGTA